MVKNLDNSLSNLEGASVQVSAGNSYPEPGMASVLLLFSNGSWLRAEYWRITKDGKAWLSSFDHQQKYGLPVPIDAIKVLQEQLQGKVVSEAHLDKETSDLIFQFSNHTKFHAFNFTGYEISEICFA